MTDQLIEVEDIAYRSWKSEKKVKNKCKKVRFFFFLWMLMKRDAGHLCAIFSRPIVLSMSIPYPRLPQETLYHIPDLSQQPESTTGVLLPLHITGSMYPKTPFRSYRVRGGGLRQVEEDVSGVVTG